ncbi:Lysophosphatidic acid phosphatase type 6 [Octopus vulgaris]|uniref:Lysophosphatidic acid phosphatase type 6 n=1 Tax=Octopus vulgaris TaxID=6645 RepID=A0AA36BT98_OCTVU|nr:Lysophosphatidic acid phosphatase type 6 [Octopus vulgaris]
MNRLGRRLWRFSVVYSRDYCSSSSRGGGGGGGGSGSSSSSSSSGGGGRGSRGGVVLTGVSLVMLGSTSITLMASNKQEKEPVLSSAEPKLTSTVPKPSPTEPSKPDTNPNLAPTEPNLPSTETNLLPTELDSPSTEPNLPEQLCYEPDLSEEDLVPRKENPLVACISRLLCRFKVESSSQFSEDQKPLTKSKLAGKLPTCCETDISKTTKQGPTKNCITHGTAEKSQQCPPPGLVLKKALVIFRHGARTPILTIPNIEQASYTTNLFMTGMPFAEFDYNVVDEANGGPQPYSATEASYRPVILKGGAISAQLTSLGHYQTYSLGLSLRKDYIEKHKLISSELKNEEIFLKSTNITRTIKSLCSVLSGLYGPIEIRKVAPISIPVASDNNEVLIPKPSLCPNLLHYHMLAQKVAYCQSDMLYDRLKIEKVLGIDSFNTKERIKWIEARDDLVARKVHGLPIPNQLEPFMNVIEKHATTLLYKSLCGLEKDDRRIATVLSCGKAIDLFLQHLGPDSKDSNYKLYLYSCHDSSLCAILGAFDIFDYKWPPFAADLRIELYEDKKSHKFVKVSYLNKDVISRGCDEIYTSYDKFVKGLSCMATDKETHDKLCNSSEICRKFSQAASSSPSTMSSSSVDNFKKRNSLAKAAGL